MEAFDKLLILGSPAVKPKEAVAKLSAQGCKISAKKRGKRGDGECLNVLGKKQKSVNKVEGSVDGWSAASSERVSEDFAKMAKETEENKREDGEGAAACDSISIRHEQLIENGLSSASHGGGSDADELDWEEGSVSYSGSRRTEGIDHLTKNVTVEFSTPSSSKKQPRRASAKEKELAELVHKVHLLCLLARGRLVDAACDDPLIQASLFSLLPPYLLNFSEKQKLTANKLVPLVEWIAALSVALFRALGLTTRFVSILDAAPLKLDIEDTEDQELEEVGQDKLRSSSRKAVANLGQLFTGVPPCASTSTKNLRRSVLGTYQRRKQQKNPNNGNDSARQLKESSNASQSNTHVKDDIMKPQICDTHGISVATGSHASGPKRKGDLEFEMQIKMAVSATAAAVQNDPHVCSENLLSDLAHVSPDTKAKCQEYLNNKEGSSAFWTRKIGAPLYWAEVYCEGEMLTGKWVHVDAANAIIDGENKVEASVAACKKILRYVVAFAGFGAKDVTRRYCTKWYTIASKRIDARWWNAVMAPLKELESGETDGITRLEALKNGVSTRSSLEDMELETRALTEPLPTNQQAYRNHHLYAIERWLTKYEVLYPNGPLLGYCSGHPVYPRSCVQTVCSKQRWLREGLQVKENELPAKVVKHTRNVNRVQTFEDGDELKVNDKKGTLELYGKWQTELLCLPHATDGIVPKNDRGQLEVWSEKCLPPGTVHLRLPRLEPVARRLGVDFAPAMVGFEFRNGQSVPLFEGIVVCQEFREAILEAYAEEEERRAAQEKIRNEALAVSRWTQLLSSIITRQRLKNSYETPSANPISHIPSDQGVGLEKEKIKLDSYSPVCNQGDKFTALSVTANNHHEHVFPAENQSFDEESSLRTKRCPCGFSIQIEEM
ncbi:DNA repair protein [Nymphaea thermarum]|nr:DNA repair protein [Nymphaea thermarum]